MPSRCTAAESLRASVLRTSSLRMRVGLRDRRFTSAQRLHLGAHQHDAGFDGAVDGIGEARLAVVGDDLLFRIGFFRHQAIPACAIASRMRTRACSLAATMGRRTSSVQWPRTEAAYLAGAGLDSQNIASWSGVRRS